MASASPIVVIITFEMLFFTFIFAYGISVGGIDIQNTMSQITGNWPVIGTSSCTFSQGGPSAGCTVLDTALLGTVWVFASVGSLFYRMGAALFLIYQLVQITGVALAIPFFGGFVLMIQIIFGLYGYSLVRGNQHGLGGSA
jgi:hypothetical protein